MLKKILGFVALIVLLSGFYEYPTSYPEMNQKRQLSFPRDHFAHRDFRTEWWYFNGFLGESSARQYAFHLAFFVRRTELDFYKRILPIRWFYNPVHLAHFSLVDLTTGEKVTAQKRSRDATRFRGSAGASVLTAEVWNGDWRYSEEKQEIKLQISEQDFNLSLILEETQALVLHGDQGSFIKADYNGKSRGSYYVSRPRLYGSGTLELRGREQELSVNAWMDHEFGSYHLSPQQSGWNWFSIMLDDDSELVLYMLKNLDGSLSTYSMGTWVDANGVVTPISFDDIKVKPERHWQSARSGARYPTRWNIQIPSLELDLSVAAIVEDLEFDSTQSTMITYWEGPVTAEGRLGKRSIAGFGFQELTGNVEPLWSLSQ